MKMFVVLALAVLAAAEPEADPQLLVSGIHGVHPPYTHVAPVSTYSSPLLKTLVPAVKSIVPAVKAVVPAVKTVASTPVVSTYGSTYGVGYPMTYGANTIIPAVKTVAATPLVSTYNTAYGAGYPLTYGAHAYGVIAAPKAVITNYQDSEHYTAEATPLGKALGEPSYVAKNGEVVHKVEKREAEADAALFYSGLHTPSVYSTGINSVYNRAVVSPYTYGSSLYRNVLPAVSYRSPCIGCHPALSHMIHKREAEADPALVYSGLTHTPYTGISTAAVNPIVYSGLTHTPFTGINSVYNTAAVNPVVYSGLTHTPFTRINSVYNTAAINPVVYNAGVVKAQDHGVAVTPFGAVHSSHVGKCLNNEGVEVSC
jgi:hypothetical protein